MRHHRVVSSPVLLLSLALVLPGCSDKGDEDASSDGVDGTDGTDGGPVDADQDGFTAGEDCDDTRSDIYPGADEICDGEDNDCDEEIDEGVIQTWYTDTDADGFGQDGTGVEACTQPAETSDAAGDCDDDDDTRFPGATEVCEDGVVNDCNGSAQDARLACPHAWPTTTAGGDHRFTGSTRYARAGSALAVGDVTGDGLDDLLVGSPREERSGGDDNGAAFLLEGAATLTDGTLRTMASTSALGGDDARLGTAVAVAPDLNGDGTDDVILGASGSFSGAPGFARIHYGGPDLDLGDLDGRFLADRTHSVGAAVAGVGDVDGDGLGDLLVGQPNHNSGMAETGAVYLLLGPAEGGDLAPTTTWTNSGMRGSYFGDAVAGAGDIDGDGRADLLMGAPSGSSIDPLEGLAFLVLGDSVSASAMDPIEADAVFVGGDAYDALGRTVAGGVDLDGDGLDDVLVGAPNVDDPVLGGNTGAVYFFSGATASGFLDATEADGTLLGQDAYQIFGSSITPASDVNDDGLADVLVGAPGYYDEGPSSAGAVYAFSGDLTGVFDTSDAAFAIEDGTVGDGTGASAGTGDVNGDGTLDLLLGQPGDGTGGSVSGGVSVLLGGTAY